MIDPVQAPPLRHTFELVNASILEADSRLRHQILDRTRDQDFAGTRFRGDARPDVKRETKHFSPAHFVALHAHRYRTCPFVDCFCYGLGSSPGQHQPLKDHL